MGEAAQCWYVIGAANGYCEGVWCSPDVYFYIAVGAANRAMSIFPFLV